MSRRCDGFGTGCVALFEFRCDLRLPRRERVFDLSRRIYGEHLGRRFVKDLLALLTRERRAGGLLTMTAGCHEVAAVPTESGARNRGARIPSSTRDRATEEGSSDCRSIFRVGRVFRGPIPISVSSACSVGN